MCSEHYYITVHDFNYLKIIMIIFLWMNGKIHNMEFHKTEKFKLNKCSNAFLYNFQ